MQPDTGSLLTASQLDTIRYNLDRALHGRLPQGKSAKNRDPIEIEASAKVQFTFEEWSKISHALLGFRLGYFPAQHGAPFNTKQASRLLELHQAAQAFLDLFRKLDSNLMNRVLWEYHIIKEWPQVKRQTPAVSAKPRKRTPSLLVLRSSKEAEELRMAFTEITHFCDACGEALRKAEKTTASADKSHLGREELIRELNGIHKQAVERLETARRRAASIQRFIKAIRDAMPSHMVRKFAVEDSATNVLIADALRNE